MKFDLPRSEAELISDLVEVNLDYVPRSQCPGLRSEHGKGVADLVGTFTILDDIAADYAVGLFSRPGSYATTIRFSNGAKTNDSQRDTHGMAIKVHGVPMQSAPTGRDGQRFQDFILIDNPIFPLGSLRPYVPFNSAFLEAKLTLLGKLRLFMILIRNLPLAFNVLKMALNRANAPLSTDYWSTTPYKLGDYNKHKVKYMACAAPRRDRPPRIVGKEGRRDALRQQLASEPGKFTFGVLVQTDPARQPVEDPSVDWQKNGAAFVPLAELDIPSEQPVEAPEAEESALTYSPGHSSVEHFPIGALNRARVAIYAAASRARQAALRKGD